MEAAQQRPSSQCQLLSRDLGGLVPRDGLNGGSGAAAVGDAAGCLLRTGIEALLSRWGQRERLQRVPPAAWASKRGPAGLLGAGKWDLEVKMKVKLSRKWKERKGSVGASLQKKNQRGKARWATGWDRL